MRPGERIVGHVLICSERHRGWCFWVACCGQDVGGGQCSRRSARGSIGRDQWLAMMGSSLGEVIAFLQLGTPCSVSFPVPDTEILTHKRPVAIGEITPVDLLGGV